MLTTKWQNTLFIDHLISGSAYCSMRIVSLSSKFLAELCIHWWRHITLAAGTGNDLLALSKMAAILTS